VGYNIAKIAAIAKIGDCRSRPALGTDRGHT